ncbi:MAG: PDZ domain-containing protein [Dehalococcoidia bacterium]|nr:MAG: PDZ domain-containing protein [Dehalococcoidia bacterium]
MVNRVIIGILVFLVILYGGLGYYAYTLNQQFNSLSEQLTAFQAEQANRIDAVSDELNALSVETLTRVSYLGGKIDENLTQIATLKGELDGSLTKIGTLEDRLGGTLAKIDILEGEIRDIPELPQTVLDASEVYQRVSQATVRISNGERTIGSGFIFDNEAHVLTASHVVENLSQIYVVLPDGRISTATSTGSCLFSDVAVLTLEDELIVEPIMLADSASVRIGEPVAAIGNPLNLTETLTTGIVSQTNRYAEIDYDSQTRWVTNLIQFDAAVNAGNSGCPLVNAEGEVIGVVIARIEPDEGDGIYYAVSSNKVKRVAASLIAQGSFDYPWLGVVITDLTPQIVQTKALETANGVLVTEIAANSPAEAAGIEAEDIIVAIDGVTIRDVATLTSYLGEHKSPGEIATITLIRDTTELELSLEIGKRT